MKSNNNGGFILAGLAVGAFLLKNNNEDHVNGIGALPSARKRILLIQEINNIARTLEESRRYISAFCQMTDSDINTAYSYVFVYDHDYTRIPNSLRVPVDRISNRYQLFA